MVQERAIVANLNVRIRSHVVETPAVDCHNLSRKFGNRMAVSHLDLTVPRGTVFGFLGPNGAGKTTTIRMMLGMLRPSSGSLRVLGLNPITEGQQLRTKCGVMLDNVGLYDRLSAHQNLELAARVAHMPRRERQQRIEASLHRVGLWDRRDDRVSGFSKGMRQKLGLARALLSDPEMLILDEPTAGLDPTNIVMVRELLQTLVQESGQSIVLSTHLLVEAQRICDQVAIIQDGQLVAVGAPDQLGHHGLPTVRLTLSGDDLDIITSLPLPPHATLHRLSGHDWRATLSATTDTEDLVAVLVNAHIGVRAVIPEHVSLEEEYLRLVGGNPHE